MSAHPFGQTCAADIDLLQLFSIAVSSYMAARNDLAVYQTVGSELDFDDPYYLALEITKLRAAEVVKAHALTLMGHGILDRCIEALEEQL